MRSTCSSLSSPDCPEAAAGGLALGDSRTAFTGAVDSRPNGISSAPAGFAAGGSGFAILSRSSKLNFGKAFVSPAGAPGCSSQSEGDEEVNGGVVLGPESHG